MKFNRTVRPNSTRFFCPLRLFFDFLPNDRIKNLRKSNRLFIIRIFYGIHGFVISNALHPQSVYPIVSTHHFYLCKVCLKSSDNFLYEEIKFSRLKEVPSLNGSFVSDRCATGFSPAAYKQFAAGESSCAALIRVKIDHANEYVKYTTKILLNLIKINTPGLFMSSGFRSLL